MTFEAISDSILFISHKKSTNATLVLSVIKLFILLNTFLRFIRVLKVKDYIETPKESGYKSYHMICEIDVPLGNVLVPVKCEIQIRTLLMDAWSSLEHEIIYKNKNCSEASVNELLKFSYSLSSLESSMKLIRHREVNGEIDSIKRKIKPRDLREFKDYKYIYECAQNVLTSYIKIAKEEYDKCGVNSDVQNIKYRIKSINSIDKKLDSQGLEFNMTNINEHIKDVVAARIICLDLEDVEAMVNTIRNSPFIKVVQEKDYISKAKESGYRAHHLIVEIPVELSTGTIPVRCEVQVRTVLMDAWSSLEHEIIYKNDNCSNESRRMLRDYSYLLESMDKTMVDIKNYEVNNLLGLNNRNDENVKVLSKTRKKG
jgi:putative GTP pyrophosphokinase